MVDASDSDLCCPKDGGDSRSRRVGLDIGRGILPTDQRRTCDSSECDGCNNARANLFYHNSNYDTLFTTEVDYIIL